jgi:hypothetical protein
MSLLFDYSSDTISPNFRIFMKLRIQFSNKLTLPRLQPAWAAAVASHHCLLPISPVTKPSSTPHTRNQTRSR